MDTVSHPKSICILEAKMADAKPLLLGGVILSLTSCLVEAGQFCTDHEEGDIFGFNKKTFWCEHGCCGSYYNTHCCTYLSAGIISWIVGGVLFVVGTIATIIVMVCCCLRKRRYAGQTCTNVGATPGPSSQMATVNTGGMTVQTIGPSYSAYPPPPMAAGYPPTGQVPGYQYSAPPIGFQPIATNYRLQNEDQKTSSPYK